VLGDIEENFHCACTETATPGLPVKNLTLSLSPATSISYNSGITRLSVYIFPCFSDFFGAHTLK